MISNRYAKANNPYMKEYIKGLEHSYIIYMDMNNLYGGAMLRPLPVGNFKWDNDVSKYTTEYILKMDVNGTSGATLMVDGDYPEELHDKHNDYPLCPEKMTVTKEMFSPHNLYLTELAGEKPKDNMKLVPNLKNKTNYVLHYTALQQCLRLGMKLTKVHKVITYDQKPWLKSYIDFNTQNRKLAKENKNAFLTDFYKLMNNSVFGKTMENVRKKS